MAKQNFLSGGFYGKLGVVVGQRWKNIRTIRSYVIPANPRTERQQANRGVFGGATKWSQIGMTMNYNATCFEHNSMSRWNYRMRTCRNLQDDGSLDLQLIPLYPTTFTPPFMINSMQIVERLPSKKVVFSVAGTLPNVDRVLSVMFHLYDENDRDLGLKLYMGDFKAGAEPTVEVTFDDLSEINDHCKVRLVSRDDVDSATDLIGSPMLPIEDSAPDIRDFNTAILSITKTLSGVTIAFAEPFKAFSSSSFSGSVYAVSAGAFKEVSGDDLALENVGGYFGVTIPCDFTDEQQILAFAEGSEIRITSISAIGAKYEYTKENDTITFSDDDLARNISKSFTYNASEQIRNRVFFKLAVSASQSLGNGACVFSGRFDDKSVMTLPLTLQRYSASQAEIDVGGLGQSLPATSGDYITVPTFSVVSNGVTYSLPTSTKVSITNGFISSNWLQQDNTFYYTRDGGGAYELEYLCVDIGFNIIAENDSITAPSTNNAKMVCGTGSTAELSTVMDVNSEEVAEENHIMLLFSFSGSKTHALTEETYANGSNWYVMHKGIEYEINYNLFPQKLSGWEQ